MWSPPALALYSHCTTSNFTKILNVITLDFTNFIRDQTCSSTFERWRVQVLVAPANGRTRVMTVYAAETVAMFKTRAAWLTGKRLLTCPRCANCSD